MLHNEVTTTRNWTHYNFQVLRDDVYMLGKDGTVPARRISPVRSSSAVVVSSQDLNRQWIYYQQQTVSAEGYSGQAFNTHVPHTVAADGNQDAAPIATCRRTATTTRSCRSCFTLGTNFVNFMGRFVCVGTGEGGVAGGRRDRDGRAAGRDRQRAAQAGLSRGVRGAREARPEADDLGAPRLVERDVGAGARRVRLHRRRRGRLQGLRHRPDQPEGFLREDRHRAGVADRAEHQRQDALRHRGGRAEHAGGRSGRGSGCRSTRSSRSPVSTATSTSPIARKAW